jgi:hypothetical protein
MRVTGGYNSNWVTAIGCNPVSVGSNDGYEYLEKGIINSFLYDWIRSILGSSGADRLHRGRPLQRLRAAVLPQQGQV